MCEGGYKSVPSLSLLLIPYIGYVTLADTLVLNAGVVECSSHKPYVRR